MCSYCGCYENPLIRRFMDEHDLLINLMGVIRRGIDAGDTDAVAAACDDVAALFAPHSEDEEAGLFTEMRQEPEFAPQVEALCSEHGTLDALVLAVREGQWERFPEFELLLRRHIDKEDNGLFPAANIALFGDAWERIDARTAEAMQRRGERAVPHALQHPCEHGHDHPHPQGHAHPHEHPHA